MATQIKIEGELEKKLNRLQAMRFRKRNVIVEEALKNYLDKLKE